MKTVALAVISLLSVRASFACSCMGPTPVCSVYWTTPLLFLGHVVRIENVSDPPTEQTVDGKKITLSGPGQNLVHFDVTKSFRGTSGQQIVIHTNDQGSACGFPFEEGHDYLVFGDLSPNGDAVVSHCSRTHEVTSRADDPDLQWIEALPKSKPGASIFGRIQRLSPNQEGGYDFAALPDIAVSIQGAASRTISTDADGKFHADGLASGKYTVSAVPPVGYAPFSKSTPELRERSCAEVDWTTRLDGHIRGHVYFTGGAPAAELYLTAKRADSNPHEPWTWQASYTNTAADGSFDFGNLAPGSYIFAVNMDFPAVSGTPYYKRAFYPGGTHPSEAAVLAVGAGETVDNLRFILPPDAAAPNTPLTVTVAGFDGAPVPHAEIIAYDDMWENSVAPAMADADDRGKATIMLRPGSHYDIEAVENLPDFSQSCAEPIGVDVHDQPAPIILVLAHHVGNCLPFRKTPAH